MAARTQGYSLLLSDICYTLPHTILISLPPVTRPYDCVRFERMAHPV